MRAVANGKILSIFMTSWQTLKQKNHKFLTNSSAFTKQDIFGEDIYSYHIPAFSSLPSIFIVKFGQEMGLAPVIVMDFIC